MISAGIFDIGGVLLQWSNQPMYEDIMNTLSVSEDDLTRFLDEHLILLGCGKITEDEFWERFLRDTKVSVQLPEKSLFLREFEKRYQVNQEVLTIVQEMKNLGYPLAVLSNTISPHLEFMRSKRLFDLFDVTIFSNEVGYEKPAREIYEITLKKLNVQADQTFFVDDLPENIEGADDVGIHGILFTDAVKLREDIQKLGVRI